MLTRVFKSGNSLAVRIPKELANAFASQDVEIEKVGDTLVLRPVVKRKLTGLAEAFSMFTPDFMAEGREFHEQKERDWSGFGESAQLHQTSADYKSHK
ncbi:MAG: AbrB/MazE/SpoVT family DNA-binding domain-containing protein [Pseudomonadota bacterium]